MRTAPAVVAVTWVCLGVVGVGEAQVIKGAAPAIPPTPAETKPTSSPVLPAGAIVAAPRRPADEAAIRSIAESYARAYNAGDSRALAALFADDAEMIDEDGERMRGRSVIEDVFRSMFKERPGASIAISPASLRFLGPDAAREEGQTQVKTASSEGPTTRHYTVLYVKEGKRWLYSSVREEREKHLSHHQRLQELAWLLGDWVDETPDSVVHSTCQWTADRNFLVRDFSIQVQGKPVMTVNERIGWDPSTRQIKSWVFDSEGGHGCGLWSRNGNEWVIKLTGILPDGRTATATHILTRLSPQSARWSSVERTVGDQVVPDHAEYVMVRRPPATQTQAR